MFFIASMPRTRTCWLAAYFDGLPGVRCHHELLNGLKSRQEFYDAMESPGVVGDSDCGLFLTDFQTRWPDAPTLIVERPLGEIRASLKRVMELQDRPQLKFLKNMSGYINSLKGMRVGFYELDARLPEIHNYFGIPFNEEYATHMSKLNVQLKTLTGDPDSVDIWR